MKKSLIILLSIIYIFISCDYATDKNALTKKQDETSNLVHYAENFKISPYKDGYKLEIRNKNSSNFDDFYIFNDSLDIPEEIKNQTIIRTPIKSAIAFSSTQWSVFQNLAKQI